MGLCQSEKNSGLSRLVRARFSRRSNGEPGSCFGERERQCFLAESPRAGERERVDLWLHSRLRLEGVVASYAVLAVLQI